MAEIIESIKTNASPGKPCTNSLSRCTLKSETNMPTVYPRGSLRLIVLDTLDVCTGSRSLQLSRGCMVVTDNHCVDDNAFKDRKSVV